MVHRFVVFKLVYHCFCYHVRAQKFPREGNIFLRVVAKMAKLKQYTFCKEKRAVSNLGDRLRISGR